MNASDELRQLVDALSLHFADVSLRGEGRARFLFAQHQGRAVEISANEGKWWLEFWDVDPDPDAAPVKELTLETAQEAANHATDWLNGKPGNTVRTNIKGEVPRDRVSK